MWGDMGLRIAWAWEQVSVSAIDLGIHDGIDSCIEIAHSLHVTKEAFLAYLRDVVIPSIGSRQNLPGCQEKSAIPFCDDCSCQSFKGLMCYCSAASRRRKNIDRAMTIKIRKSTMPCTFLTDETARRSSTVRGSWEKAGFGLVKRGRTDHLCLSEGKIRTNPEFV
jgi:hypothetical protein